MGEIQPREDEGLENVRNQFQQVKCGLWYTGQGQRKGAVTMAENFRSVSFKVEPSWVMASSAVWPCHLKTRDIRGKLLLELISCH